MEWRIETYDFLPTTQDVLKRPEYNNAPEGTVIQASIQTAGRGRRGRIWAGDHAGNLYISFLLRPKLQTQKLGQIGLVAGIALARAIAPLLKNQADLVLKWPNDVLLAGKKCAGILVEVDDDHKVTIGVGVNVESAPLDTAACLNDFALSPVSANGARDMILNFFSDLYRTWYEQGFEALRGEWLMSALPPGTLMTVKHGGQIYDGLFETIDIDGNLILRTDSGNLQTLTCGEVFL